MFETAFQCKKSYIYCYYVQDNEILKIYIYVCICSDVKGMG